MNTSFILTPPPPASLPPRTGGHLLALPSFLVRYILGVCVTPAVWRERDGQGGHGGRDHSRPHVLREVSHFRRVSGWCLLRYTCHAVSLCSVEKMFCVGDEQSSDLQNNTTTAVAVVIFVTHGAHLLFVVVCWTNTHIERRTI